ncbi:hypothetical protein [Flavobacterium cucumis]|nr:hypothetical protein [Flavobacterium cucumis]
MQHIQGISRHQLQMSSLEDKITYDNLSNNQNSSTYKTNCTGKGINA